VLRRVVGNGGVQPERSRVVDPLERGFAGALAEDGAVELVVPGENVGEGPDLVLVSIRTGIAESWSSSIEVPAALRKPGTMSSMK